MLDYLDIGSIPDCNRPSLGGVSRVWVGDRANYRFAYEITNNKQLGGIDAFGRIGDEVEKLVANNATLTQTERVEPSLRYDIVLTFDIRGWETDARDYLQRVQWLNRAIFFVDAGNGMVWIVGENGGCTIESQAQTGDVSEVNRYRVTVRTQQPYPLRALSEASSDCLGAEGTIELIPSVPLPIEVPPPTGTDPYYYPEDGIVVDFGIVRKCCLAVVGAEATSSDPDVEVYASPVLGAQFSVSLYQSDAVQEDTPFTLSVTTQSCKETLFTFPAIRLGKPFEFSDAWEFDGVNDTVVINNALLGNFGITDFTYSFWVRFPVLGTFERILYRRNVGSPFRGVYFVKNDSNRLQFAVGNTTDPASIHIVTSLTLLANTWYHVAFCKETSTRANWRLYINGTSQTFNNAGTETNGVDSTQPIWLARDQANPSFYGRFLSDETTIYNKALTAGEVAHLYNAGNGNFPPVSAIANLVARYSFDTAVPSGGNFILADVSGNGNNGLSSGIATDPRVAH